MAQNEGVVQMTTDAKMLLAELQRQPNGSAPIPPEVTTRAERAIRALVRGGYIVRCRLRQGPLGRRDQSGIAITTKGRAVLAKEAA